MRLAIAQVNPTVGDLAGNRRIVEEAAAKAASERADLLVLPEMVLTGYPPMDLLERNGFVRDQLAELDALLPISRSVPIALGAVLPHEQRGSARLHNAAVLLAGGERRAVRAKSLLPSYDVFDERRYFAPAAERRPVTLRAGSPPLGLTVCEDAWVDQIGYEVDPVGELARAGCAAILNLSASPWHVAKPAERRRVVAELARKHGVPICFVNQVGGNDELIFDGGSFVVDARGRVCRQLALFEPAFEIVELPDPSGAEPAACAADPDAIAQLEAGLVLGIRDYFRKQGLPPGAVIGVSGGVDSAVTAHLAVEALGAERVLGVAMPGPFSSAHSLEDAQALHRTLGIEVRCVDVRPIYDAYLESFRTVIGEREDYGIAGQNIQSRIRGALLMAISNAEGRLVLATGNKSELSIGYCTLYGDTVGGLAVLGDVYKRDVYALARRANASAERIPARSIAKPPSAELAPGQLDSDDLPPYEILDAILERAIEGGCGAEGIAPPLGASRATVREIVERLDRNEYKRRQAPLVLRTSTKAFGSGRRLPIVHRYRA
ncbi:MAG TPA: NAD+ synthase [Myxococcota bacterium]|nr:NAD+ synthase [Myxococcota bacterium]